MPYPVFYEIAKEEDGFGDGIGTFQIILRRLARLYTLGRVKRLSRYGYSHHFLFRLFSKTQQVQSFC